MDSWEPTRMNNMFGDRSHTKPCVRWHGRFHAHEWTEWLWGKNQLYNRRCTRCKQIQKMSQVNKLFAQTMINLVMQNMPFGRILQRRRGEQIKFMIGDQVA